VSIQAGGRFVGSETTLAAYIRYAYDIQPAQLIGGPDWIGQTHFDIEGRAGREASKTEIQAMLRALLEDRFKLTVRTERREMSFQELVVNRSDGRLGDRLKSVSSEEECGEAAKTIPNAPVPAGAVIGRVCGSMSAVARIASTGTKSLVIDKTGLGGLWYASIFYNFNPLMPGGSPDLPSFETALQEQLGLRVNRVRGLADVLVVESAQLPADN
jgi:uncharacterized protein (TIGR03435 family)